MFAFTFAFIRLVLFAAYLLRCIVGIGSYWLAVIFVVSESKLVMNATILYYTIFLGVGVGWNWELGARKEGFK